MCPTAHVSLVASLGADRVVDYTAPDFTAGKHGTTSSSTPSARAHTAGARNVETRRLGETERVSYDPGRAWSADHVPPGPYLHGSRWAYQPGDLLPTDAVSNMEGEEYDRQRCYATTSLEQALDWAYRRGLRRGGRTLCVYEVEMLDPEVDINAHPPGVDQELTSVMSPAGARHSPSLLGGRG